eukprot:TRINITY_DN2079_c0_g1_i4.p1 TRINITY_DN2079_c0_g1~~TRINITY_DN2079_c0_g1_i4.p1  ORF type:complete len:264 (-),score=49.92 TRINITY_DN2079_c0_g1_i4:48-839(-)
MGAAYGTYVGPQIYWAQDYDLSSYTGQVLTNGATDAVIQVATEAANRGEPLLFLQLSPPLVLADALTKNPEIFAPPAVRFVAMSGSIATGYTGKPGAVPEFNAAFDPVASKVMYAAAIAMEIAPLDTSGIFQVFGEQYKALLDARTSNALVDAVIASYEVWAANCPLDPTIRCKDGIVTPDPGKASTTLFDLQAAAMCGATRTGTASEFLTMRLAKLLVNATGYTVEDLAIGRETRYAASWRDMDSFSTTVVDCFISPATCML